jgi:host factor-I protein
MPQRDGAPFGSPKPALLQDTYLSEVRRQAIPVTVYLVNGFQMRGLVKGFDNFTIVLEFEHRQHLIYKHAVSTISPQASLGTSLGLDSEGASTVVRPS